MGLARKRKTTSSDTSEITELPSLNLKGEKMDMSRLKQSLTLLQKLIDHQFGWVFNQPVDPVQLNIPDYFSIVKNPMDLGTVREKLVEKKYATTVQFSSDVRLTFSNAMLYNPPMNEVHMMAKNLSHVFEARWRLLEEKWSKENPKSNLNHAEEKSTKENPNPSLRLEKSGPTKKKVNLAVSCAVNAKQSEHPEYVRASVHGLPRASCEGEDADKPRPSNYIYLCSIQRMRKSVQGSDEASCKGVDELQSVERIEKRNDGGRLIFKLSSSNRPLGANNDKCNSREAISHNSTLSKKEAKVTHEKLRGMPVPRSDKRSASDGTCGIQQCQPLPYTSSAALSEKELDQFPLDEPLSPKRALRAAMLKSRFADTIVKAQQRSLLDQVDPVKLQLEREKLEREQQEEKARIEAKVRAAQMKAEADRKLKREKEREAARLALQQIKKTVDLDNSELLKELERLKCATFMQNLTCGDETKLGFLNPLEKLGLFIKDDDMDDEDLRIIPAKADMEEGEIC